VQPKAQPKAPTPPAALTATAGAGTDAFGLRAGEGGGGDCVSDCGGGDDGEQGSYYSTVVNSMVRDALRGDEKLRSARFRGQVAFTLDRAGHPENITFRDFQGDPETREMLLRALQRMVANEQIPANMTDGSPWVVRLNAHAPG